MPSLAVIIVSWNTRELLQRCVESVHASLAGAGIAYQIVVVDNASSDGTPAQLRAAHPEVQLIEAGRNLGFAGGNNLALRVLLDQRTPNTNHRPPSVEQRTRPRSADARAQGPVAQSKIQNVQRAPESKIPDYVLLLNPDTEVVGDAIPRLIGYLEAHPDVAVVGPQLRYADGSAQPSRRRFPSRGVFFWESTPLETRWPGNPWRGAIAAPTSPAMPYRRSTGWWARPCWCAARQSSAPACSMPASPCIPRSWSGSRESRE